jgi:hypothetical protein
MMIIARPLEQSMITIPPSRYSGPDGYVPLSPAGLDAYRRAVALARATPLRVIPGHHHHNYVFLIPDALAAELGLPRATSGVLRVRRTDTVQVAVRTWDCEANLAAALRGRLDVPELLVQACDEAIYVFHKGKPLAHLLKPGQRVPQARVDQLVQFMAAKARVGRDRLPQLPLLSRLGDRDGDSGSDLLRNIRTMERSVIRPNWPTFGPVFEDLGLSMSGLRALKGRAAGMRRRPSGLLHKDLHAGNVLVNQGGRPLFLDWELASWGDHLHDLAIHLIRMDYPPERRSDVIEAWRVALRDVRPEAVTGLDEDLPHWLAYEHGQSAYADVIRAADRVVRDEKVLLEEQAEKINRALLLAKAPLGLARVPSAEQAAKALQFHRDRAAQEGTPRSYAVGWFAEAPRPDRPTASLFWRRQARRAYRALRAAGWALVNTWLDEAELPAVNPGHPRSSAIQSEGSASGSKPIFA